MADLEALIRKYRKSRDGFDDLAIEAARLYTSGVLLPTLAPGQTPKLTERLQTLTWQDVERALQGKLGTVPMSRAQYESVLQDITLFLTEWLGGSSSSES